MLLSLALLEMLPCGAAAAAIAAVVAPEVLADPCAAARYTLGDFRVESLIREVRMGPIFGQICAAIVVSGSGVKQVSRAHLKAAPKTNSEAILHP